MTRKDSKPEPVTKLLKTADSSVGGLVQRAKRLLALEKTVLAAIDADIQPHCKVAGYRNFTLYLQLDSAAWAMRLRMQQHSIIASLQSFQPLKGLRTIKLSVRPLAIKPSQTRQARALSADSAHQLLQTSESTEDQALANALAQLAKRHSGSL